VIEHRNQRGGRKGPAGAARRRASVYGATLVRPDEVADRLAAVQQKVADAAGRSGRPPSAVRLVVVTKGVPPPVIRAVLDAGATELGESRAQELLAKAPEIATRPTWHFIGRLQRNKVASLAPLVDLWQSVDRLELGQTIARRVPGAAVLAEVNVAGDPAKAGVAPGEAPTLVEGLRSAGLSVDGLMTIPAAGRDPRPAFAALAELADRLGLAEVSMGMSDDYEVAVEEGATIVRVGRAIFGWRPPERQGPR
jgi:PLP dependent protein